MFSWRKPNDVFMAALTETLHTASLTYESPDGRPPSGFDVDQLCVELGKGEFVFSAAKRALVEWKMFPSAMSSLWPSKPEIRSGEIVHVFFRAGPMWTTNSCRILKVIDESNEVTSFGFTYGTLPGHVERGEETFLVSWDRRTNQVNYSLRVFSRPAHWLIWLGYPYARYQQARFRRLSGNSMQNAVSYFLSQSESVN